MRHRRVCCCPGYLGAGWGRSGMRVGGCVGVFISQGLSTRRSHCIHGGTIRTSVIYASGPPVGAAAKACAAAATYLMFVVWTFMVRVGSWMGAWMGARFRTWLGTRFGARFGATMGSAWWTIRNTPWAWFCQSTQKSKSKNCENYKRTYGDNVCHNIFKHLLLFLIKTITNLVKSLFIFCSAQSCKREEHCIGVND